MEINLSPNKIGLKKELNHLDNLAIEFCQILNNLNIRYIIFQDTLQFFLVEAAHQRI